MSAPTIPKSVSVLSLGLRWASLASMGEMVPPEEEPQPFLSPVPATSTVLVIDDDLSIRAMVAELLEFEGYQVATAANGAEGLLLVPLLRPHAILLDMRMPVLDGWGFARELERLAPGVPIIVMTAAQNVEGWANEIGAAAAIAKPFNIVELLDALERVLA